MIMLATAFAQDTVEETTGYPRAEIKENFDTSKSTLNDTRQTLRNNEETLLQELLQADSASKTELTTKEEPCDSNECVLEPPQ
jgi:hypothetical protein